MTTKADKGAYCKINVLQRDGDKALIEYVFDQPKKAALSKNTTPFWIVMDDNFGYSEHCAHNYEFRLKTNVTGDNDIIIYGWDGKRNSNAIFRDGKAEGTWLSWYKSGAISSERHYKNGVLNGLVTSWDENGKKRIEAGFKNGRHHGYDVSCNEQGYVTSVTYYNDGDVVGELSNWFMSDEMKPCPTSNVAVVD